MAALSARGITDPTPVQAATIPDLLAGRDVCGRAPTGSGKTIAFGIPMVQRVRRAAPKRPKGLVLAPTRELALQVADEIRSLGDLRVAAVYGGAPIAPQMKKLRAGVDIVVACPGRLLDVIDRGACDLRDVAFVVLDEADRMADMGFLPSVRRLLDQTSPSRQTALFSATLDGDIDGVVKSYTRNPVVRDLGEEAAGDIVHHFWKVDRAARTGLTADIIARTGPTVVFSRTRHGADRISRQLRQAGVSSAAIHGNRSQSQRERALAEFHRGDVQALVATDVAARGIHVDGVACVVHYDLPADPKDYVHRSGRTGRAGETGVAVALVTPEQVRDANKLARGAEIEVTVEQSDLGLLPRTHISGWGDRKSPRSPLDDTRPARPGRPRSNGGPKGEPKSGPRTGPKPGSKPGSNTSGKPGSKPTHKAGPKHGSKPGSGAGSKPGHKAGSKAGPKAGPKGYAKAGSSGQRSPQKASPGGSGRRPGGGGQRRSGAGL